MAAISDLMHQNPWLTGAALLALVVGALSCAAVIVRALIMAAGALFALLVQWVERASLRLAELIFTGVRGLVCMTVALLCWPFKAFWFAARRALDQMREAQREAQAREQELRRLWREAGQQFPTFEAFQRAFEAEEWRQQRRREEPRGNPPPDRPAAPDAFAEACRLFGFPADGGFSREDLNARYRSLIHRLHGDRGGSDVLAAQVNTARDVITKRKGWK
jgi:hypothetical protein